MDGSGFHVKIHRLVMMRLGEILDLMIFLTALVSNQQLSSLDLALSKRSLSDAFNVAYRTSERARLAAVAKKEVFILGSFMNLWTCCLGTSNSYSQYGRGSS